MAAPREIELKLDLDPPRAGRGGVTKVRIHRLIQASGRVQTRRLVSSIFDTQDHALRRRGLVLRIRRDGERRIQTLKAGRVGSILDRSEWESDVAGDEPDLALIPEALREEVAAAGPLAPVLETDFERTLWLVRHQGSDVELVFDEGEIRAGGRTEPIREIEIELKSGSPSALFGIAREIVGTVQARPGLRSKSERGFALLGRERRKADAFRVQPEMTVAAAFRSIAQACLRQYRLNEPGILARDAGALHRARVGLRRLRTCLKLHKRLIADPEGEGLRRELRNLSRGLGHARNLDVFIERLNGEGQAGKGVERLLAERERAYDRLRVRLNAKRTRLLLLELVAYLETGAWLRDPERRRMREKNVCAFARKVLEKRRARLLEAGRDLAGLTPEARHEVRIDAKVLRYAGEFFAGAFPDREAKERRAAYIEAVTELQTHLGDLNDIETWGELSAIAAGLTPVDPGRASELIAAAQGAHGRIEAAERFWT